MMDVEIWREDQENTSGSCFGWSLRFWDLDLIHLSSLVFFLVNFVSEVSLPYSVADCYNIYSKKVSARGYSRVSCPRPARPSNPIRELSNIEAYKVWSLAFI
jgi:hypothetical protein